MFNGFSNYTTAANSPKVLFLAFLYKYSTQGVALNQLSSSDMSRMHMYNVNPFKNKAYILFCSDTVIWRKHCDTKHPWEETRQPVVV